MNFLTDANIPRQVIERLRQERYQVFAVAEMEPGIDDVTVLEIANRENAILVTADTDFGELVFREARTNVGVILVRLNELSPSRRAEIIAETITQYRERMSDAFTVITPGRIRIRSRA